MPQIMKTFIYNNALGIAILAVAILLTIALYYSGADMS